MAGQRKRRAERSLKPGDEFLSGIKKEDRFIPVITLCFYYGELEWDAGTSLFELLDLPKGEEWIYEYLSDYRLNLVHAGNVKPEHFATGLRQVFQQKEEKGIRIGEKRGIQIGEKRGENRVNHLLQRMIEDGRMNEINRMASDRAYQEKLFQEYGI